MPSRFAVTDLMPSLAASGRPDDDSAFGRDDDPPAAASTPRAASAVASPPASSAGTTAGNAARDAEAGRLALLRRLDILDTLPESIYDDIVMLASSLCGAPISLVSLVDHDRQWFKARCGLEVGQTDREIAFCAHAIETPDALFVVEDALADPRFRANPLVTGGPGIRFYAGAPIRMPGGEALGTVCVIDTLPRLLGPAQRAALTALSRQTSALLLLRLEQKCAEERAAELAAANVRASVERQRSADLLEMVLRGGNLGFWDLDVPDARFRANDREYEIVGHAPGAKLDWYGLVHPDDWAAMNAALAPHLAGEADSYGCEHRMRHRDGRWVWVQSRAVIVERRSDGSPRRIVGTHMDISARVDSLHALQHASALLQRMGSMARIGGWQLELASGRIEWTDEVYRIHELDATVDPRLVEALAHYPSPGRETLERAIDRTVRHGIAFDLELPFVTAKGRELHIRTQGEAVRADGSIVRLTGTFQDITAQKATERAALESRRRLRLITDHVPALIAYVDADERYRFMNATMQRLLGARGAAAIGRTVREVRGEKAYDLVGPRMHAALRGEMTEFTYVDEVIGRSMHLQSTYVPDVDVHAGGAVRGFYSMTIDITQLVEAQQRLETLARVDALTGLPNRRTLEERLEEAMLRARRSGGTLAVLFLDIDRFKSINDSLGHAAGDAVLRDFARRLQHCMRATDTVARVAGDEFVVLAEGAGATRDVAALGQKIVDDLQPCFMLESGPLAVTASIGITMWHGEPATTGAELLARADAALYTVKRRGRNGFSIDAG